MLAACMVLFADQASAADQYHFAAKWGTLGSGDGQFNHPGGVETDAAGRLLGLPAVVYVADSYNNRIQKFTANGSLITKWGTAGSGEGQFSRPWDVATDLAGNVYVADGRNNGSRSSARTETS